MIFIEGVLQLYYTHKYANTVQFTERGYPYTTQYTVRHSTTVCIYNYIHIHIQQACNQYSQGNFRSNDWRMLLNSPSPLARARVPLPMCALYIIEQSQHLRYIYICMCTYIGTAGSDSYCSMRTIATAWPCTVRKKTTKRFLKKFKYL